MFAHDCLVVNCGWKNAANGAIIKVAAARGFCPHHERGAGAQNDSQCEIGVFSRDGVVRANLETG
jgi:hypothetical protein